MHWFRGATWFFTVALARRRDNTLLVDWVDALRAAFRHMGERHPFHVDAIVILPEHLHCIWTLPPGDADFPTRRGLIKAGFSRSVPPGESRRVDKQSASTFAGVDGGCAIAYPPYGLGSASPRRML